MKNRIGIFGGTFNPVHAGHLLLAQSAVEQCDLNRVLFIPCSIPPHKEATNLATASHRLAMLEAAIEDDLRFELCDIEIKRGGPSYTIDTLTELGEMYPGAEFFFLIGSDTLPELHLWNNIYGILDLCRMITFVRPGFDVDSVKEDAVLLDSPWPRRLLEDVMPSKLADVSSSEIRYRIAEGMSIKYLVPASVEMYIAEHALYGM